MDFKTTQLQDMNKHAALGNYISHWKLTSCTLSNNVKVVEKSLLLFSFLIQIQLQCVNLERSATKQTVDSETFKYHQVLIKLLVKCIQQMFKMRRVINYPD